MKRIAAATAIIVTLVATVTACDYTRQAAHLQACGFTVHAGPYQGSGTLIVRNVEGLRAAFILTAHHVISEQRTVSADGSIVYTGISVSKDLVNNGLVVGQSGWDCELVSTSPADDIAILRVRGVVPMGAKSGIEFDTSLKSPPVGLPVLHCGSPAGQRYGHNSVTDGIIAGLGRVFFNRPHFQTTASARPGSSGGMIVNASNCKYIGMLVIGLSGTDNFNYCVPVRRIVNWGQKNGLAGLFDPDVPLTAEALATVKIETTKYDPAIDGARQCAGLLYATRKDEQNVETR